MSSGILLVDKPAGLTSHDVVARVRRLAGTRKVGHAGTLDPMATGLLVLGIDSSTRLLTYLVGLDKQYETTIRLGTATTTDDAEGEQVGETIDTSAIDRAAILAAIHPLTGAIQQVPSSVSAIKIDGRRSYDRVRAGEEVSLPARSVTVTDFDVLEVRGGPSLELDARIDCSSGTYIRALARDLGADLGVGGHLTALRRTRVGPFTIEEAHGLDDSLVDHLLSPADVASRLFPRVSLDPQEAVDLQNGKRIEPKALSDGLEDSAGPVAAISPDGRLLGLVRFTGRVAKVLVNFPTQEVLP